MKRIKQFLTISLRRDLTSKVILMLFSVPSGYLKISPYLRYYFVYKWRLSCQNAFQPASFTTSLFSQHLMLQQSSSYQRSSLQYLLPRILTCKRRHLHNDGRIWFDYMVGFQPMFRLARDRYYFNVFLFKEKKHNILLYIVVMTHVVPVCNLLMALTCLMLEFFFCFYEKWMIKLQVYYILPRFISVYNQ